MSDEICEDDNEETECGKPCSPQSRCEECSAYWDRMIQEGLWDPDKGWTDKGWRSITGIF